MTAKSLPITTGMRACRHWYKTPTGHHTLERVQAVVAALTADIFGYYALELGVLAGQHRFLQDSRIASQFTLGAIQGEANHLVCAPEQLPIAFSNIDLVVASHVLDCTTQPHQVLREIERVLVPEGHCILIGFNPFSWCGVRQWLPWYGKRLMPHPFYSTFRVRDWLSVLGFEVLTTVSSGYSPAHSVSHHDPRHRSLLGKVGDKYHFATGSVYVIHAQKKVSNMTPLLSSRKSVSVLRPGIMVNPGAGRVSGQVTTGQERQHGE